MVPRSVPEHIPRACFFDKHECVAMKGLGDLSARRRPPTRYSTVTNRANTRRMAAREEPSLNLYTFILGDWWRPLLSDHHIFYLIDRFCPRLSKCPRSTPRPDNWPLNVRGGMRWRNRFHDPFVPCPRNRPHIDLVTHTRRYVACVERRQRCYSGDRDGVGHATSWPVTTIGCSPCNCQCWHHFATAIDRWWRLFVLFVFIFWFKQRQWENFDEKEFWFFWAMTKINLRIDEVGKGKVRVLKHNIWPQKASPWAGHTALHFTSIYEMN